MTEVSKYAQTLLYMLHLVDSSAVTIQLQECLLINSLVNLQGLSHFNFELNHLLKLLNNNLKAFLHEQSYFSKNSDKLLKYWALNESYFLELKRTVKMTFEKINSSAHSAKSAAEDIWSMIFNLVIKSVMQVKEDHFMMNSAINLHLEGLKKLESNVIKYNWQYLSDRLTSYVGEGDEDNLDSVINFSSASELSDSLTLSIHFLNFSEGFVNWPSLSTGFKNSFSGCQNVQPKFLQ